MNENYVDTVREQLYRVEKQENMPRSAKKIVFAAADYKSEVAFSSPKTKKQKKTTSTDNKRKKNKRTVTPVSSGEYFQPKIQLFSDLGKRNQPPRWKKQDARYELSPSKSETSTLNTHTSEKELSVPKDMKTQFPERDSDTLFSTSTEDSQGSFTLSDFFDTREHSLNESVTEAHSGIDYEFIINEMDSAEISNDEIFVFPCKNEVMDSIEDLELETHDSDNSRPAVESECMDQSESKKSSSVPCVSPDILKTPIENPPKRNETAETYEIEGDILVVMKNHGSLPVFGLFILKVLHGLVKILGCDLDEQSEEICVYSPRGSSLLSIKNSTNNRKKGKLLDRIPTLTVTNCLKDIHINSTTAVFLCKKIHDPKIMFIEKYISQQIFPKIDRGELPQVVFDPKGDWNVVEESSRWNIILKTVKPSTKLLVTGGKGVGKSTFTRYAINRLLKVYKEIRIVDLDPGQSEFTVPGCVSYLTITEPLLGPNYSHLKKTDRSYLCNISVGHDPVQYLYIIKLLMREVDVLEKIPTIINYMGFTTGIGLNVIASAVTYIRPTDVVQIDSKSRKKNFESALSVDTIEKNSRLFGGYTSEGLNYKLHKMPAMTDDHGGWSLKPRQTREMCVLADLGRMMTDKVQSLTDSRLPMFEVSLSSIKITDLSGAPVPPAAANGCLVALCAKSAHENLFACLGYGVVRGVDLWDATLKLSTAEKPNTLEHVHYLVAGGVALPPSIYMTPDEVVGHVPYVNEGELVSLGQITKRTYLPAIKK